MTYISLISECYGIWWRKVGGMSCWSSLCNTECIPPTNSNLTLINWKRCLCTLLENSDDTTRWAMLPRRFVKPLHAQFTRNTKNIDLGQQTHRVKHQYLLWEPWSSYIINSLDISPINLITVSWTSLARIRNWIGINFCRNCTSLLSPEFFKSV